jgi:hypothetical protein
MRCLSLHLLCLLLFFSLASLVLADDFSDFRIPEHKVWSLTGNGSAGYWGSYASSPGTATRDDRWNGSVGGNGYWLWDSDPRMARITAATSFSGESDDWKSRDAARIRYSTPLNSENQQQVANSTALSADARLYPLPLPIGLTAGTSSSLVINKRWFKQSQRDTSMAEFRHDFTQWYRDFSFSANLGLGWGRVRDATAVYDLWVMEQRLRDAGVLTRNLSTQARHRLTSLLYFEGDYSQVHDRSSKFFWQELENIFLQDSALKDNRLDAYDLYRIAEPYFPGVSSTSPLLTNSGFVPRPASSKSSRRSGIGLLRQRGWFVGAVAAGSHYHELAKTSSHDFSSTADSTAITRTRYELENDYFAWGPQVEYHLPAGMRWQFDLNSQVLFPQHSGRAAIDARTLATATYLITDRWLAQASVLHNRLHVRDHSNVLMSTGDSDTWSVGVVASLRYYIEDHLSAGLTLSHEQINDALYRSYGEQFNRDNQLVVNLSYHFTGGLEAPGIVPASSLLPCPH